MLKISKSRIDKAGKALTNTRQEIDEEAIELEYLFDDYRKEHLQPLSEITIELQNWLTEYGAPYYIAQRLKRKPQIVRKLQRLKTRLSQLQDIGGCRIIVNDNKASDQLLKHINDKISLQSDIKILKTTDYRDRGRDDTGYRSVHIILEKDNRTIELQIRSKIQHYWAESIERTSVIYGHHLKEKEGDQTIISYFKILSDIFYELESGRKPSHQVKIELDQLRHQSEDIIKREGNVELLNSYVNEDIVKTLVNMELTSPNMLNNWIMIFDWSTGSFASWDKVERNPDEAVKSYIKYEKQYPVTDNYEVVLIGSSDIKTVRETHSHYFGIDSYHNILESLDQSILGFSNKMGIDVGARQILGILYRKKYFGGKVINPSTLKNHFCPKNLTFESSLESLIDRGLVIRTSSQSAISLDVKKRSEIESYL